jgi:hypothetical protein
MSVDVLHRSLFVLWSAVGLILLVVCVNLSNLFLARVAAHSKELAVRGESTLKILAASLYEFGADSVVRGQTSGILAMGHVTTFLS